MESVDGRPPRSAQQPCRPGTDLKGEITGEGTLKPHPPPLAQQGPKCSLTGGDREQGICPRGGHGRSWQTSTAIPKGAGLSSSLVPGGHVGDSWKSSFPGLQFPVSRENGVNHGHLFNSDLIQSSDDSDTTHLRRTGLLLGFAGFPAARQVTPWS